MCRDQLIQQLLIETLHQIVEQGRTRWLLGVLEYGFAGYSNLNDKELDAAARRFGLLEPLPDYLHDHDDLSTADITLALAFDPHYAGLSGSLLGSAGYEAD